MKNPFASKDRKPTLLSFVLQRDDCSRLLGEFSEQHLNSCSKLILVWKNGTEDVKAVTSASLQGEEALKMLMAISKEVGAPYGIKTAIVL